MSEEQNRWNIVSRSPFEPLRGFSRAVEVNGHIWVSGTTAMWQHGRVVAPGDPYEQTKYVISCIRSVLTARNYKLADIVRTRLFITDMSRWDDYARAHREAFEMIRPASSIVEVRRLVDPRIVIEMEAEAVRGASEKCEEVIVVLPEPLVGV